MQRLLAKVHKGEHHKPVGHASQPQHVQQGQSEMLPKSPLNVRRVSIADESKENIPADSVYAQASRQPQMLQERSILSSSLPSTSAESALPTFCRRSSVADDHHLQAFEASAPGRLALAIAPELGEVKGTLHLSKYLFGTLSMQNALHVSCLHFQHNLHQKGRKGSEALKLIQIHCWCASHSDMQRAGLELLDALEEGALMRVRREHMGRSSTGMGKNAQVRCVAEGFQARLLFEGQVHLCLEAFRFQPLKSSAKLDLTKALC